MAYVTVKNFKAGIDRRGSRISGDPGSLYMGENIVLNRKGEIERRKKFVPKYSLPAGTFGLHATGDVLRVFGSEADPGVPSGVTYQRLQHPDGTTAMTAEMSAENFDGKPYVIAEFGAGKRLHFYDGAVVTDWIAGIVRADMVDNDGIAEHLRALIDASDNFTATRVGAVITVTGGDNDAFAVETTVENGGATDDQAIAEAETQTAVPGVDETLASCSFQVLGGSASAGVNKITSVKVNSVEVLSVAVDWSTSNDVTAANIATQINAFTSTPEYSASADGNTVTVRAAAGTGTGPNGFALSVGAAGNVVVAKGSFDVTGGTASAGVNKTTSVKVNGVEILSTAVDWVDSFSATAAAIAAQINAFNSTPEYIAYADGPTVRISPVTSVSSDAALTVTVVNAGNVTTSTPINVSPTATAMSGGVAALAGQPQKNTFTIGGTFEAGDKFNIKLGDESFGFVGNPSDLGTTALTFKSKVYSVINSLLEFSGINAATVWNNDNAETPGANFINLAAQDEGSQANYALGVYQGTLAIFARNVIQIWSVDVDESLNAFIKPLKNTGTRSPKTVLSFGDTDLFYLSDSGIRSVRARDASNAAFVSDVGTAIDALVKADLKALPDSDITAACAVLEPNEDRYWLALGNTVYVFNFFPSDKISAWTNFDVTDDIGAPITDFARVGAHLYARAGDTIYLYGGDDGDTYPGDDEAVATVILPFLDAETPGTFKNLIGMDVGVTGNWLTSLLVNPADPSQEIVLGTFFEPTFADPRNPINHSTTHFAPKLVCSRAGPATITNLIVHYVDPNEAG